MAKPAMLCAPASSSTVTGFGAKATPGASFTGVTTMVNVFVATSTPSASTTTVTVLLPWASAAGVNPSVRSVPMLGPVLNSAGALLETR